MIKRSLAIRLMIILLIVGIMAPTFFHRAENEKRNNDVVFALNYNNAAMVLSQEEFDKTLDENKKMGVKTLLIGEESINSLISAGDITGIKYNVLCHKYDDESEDIIKQLSGDRKIHNDSYVLISKRPERKEFLDKWISAKYAENEYVKKTTPLGADVYVIYEGVSDAWKVAVGFDEQKIEYAHKKGFDIVLSMMVNAYSETRYIKHIDEIVNKYGIKFINLKKGQDSSAQEKMEKKNYTALCSMIKERDLYLILTENQTQLSNQKPIGYEKLIKSADGKVLRGYDTADFETKNTGATISDKRYYQILNSVIDRNIRFVTINQLTNGTDTFGKKSEKTNIATKTVMEKLSDAGFNTQSYDMRYDYTVNRKLVSAAALVLIILMGVMMLEWLFGKKMPVLYILGIIASLLGVFFTYIAPEAVVLLYPTLFALISSCFSFTAVMVFIKNMRKKLSDAMLIVSTLALTLLCLALCGFVQTVLLSGLDYYLNSIIFRGIKLSLIIPIAYSAVAFVLIFGENTDEHFMKKVIKCLNADIKVYWVIIAGAIGAAGAIYLIRSGNVTSISPLENFMRNTITQIMPARPRTKEFLIGWPCLVLLLYYIKNTRCTLLQWCLTVGSSILFASVLNSFCHVFTTSSVIFTRLMNGFLVGMAISLALYVLNLIAVRTVKYFVKTGKEKWGII